MALGSVPTLIVVNILAERVSTTDTVPLMALVTYARLSSALRATDEGSWPTGISASTRPESELTSTTVTELLSGSGFTTHRRLPCEFKAIGDEYGKPENVAALLTKSRPRPGIRTITDATTNAISMPPLINSLRRMPMSLSCRLPVKRGKILLLRSMDYLLKVSRFIKMRLSPIHKVRGAKKER